MAWVSAESLGSVDRLLARPHPVATAEFRALGRADARLLLRYQVSEQNRWYAETWEVAQIIVGTVFFFFMLFATRENKFALFLVLAMIAAVLVQRFLLTPQMISLGRIIDFVPPDATTRESTQFWVMHGWYLGVELVKCLLGLTLAVRLVAHRRGYSRHARQEINVVDVANHRHVDG